MRNQINLKRAPAEVFFHPTADAGLALLAQPDFFFRPIPRAVINGFSASQHAEIISKIEDFVTFSNRFRLFDKAIEFNSVPAVLQQAEFRKSYVTSGEKCILSGAAGTRLLNRYCWENEGAEPEPEKALTDYFSQCQAMPEKPFALCDAPPAPDAPIAIECRNTFNYYHFLTESLPQLCVVEQSGLTGPIYLHFPNQEDKIRDFVRNFIAALFPELMDRIRFERTPFAHDTAVISYNFFNDYFALPESQIGTLQDVAPTNLYWKGKQASRNSQAILEMNGVDSNLLRLRDKALRAIEGKDFSHLPRRFWVGRDPGFSRPRDMGGEDELVEMLGLFGFESVSFETLSPLEQVAIMANAEIMISHHGAGFANMLFANPAADVIEIGTLQTARYRWGDFWRVANASGCRYSCFFADHNTPTPLEEPVFAMDGIVPVHLSKDGMATVMAFVVSLLGLKPQLTSPEAAARLITQMLRLGETEKAAALVDQHLGLEDGHMGLSLAMAEVHEQLDDPVEQLAALYTAYRADPTQWVVLIKVIWCARKLNDLETLRAALAVLQESHPDRFEAFIKDRPWFQKQIRAA